MQRNLLQTHKISGADLASYQFPVDDEEEEEEGGDTSDGPVAQHTPSLNKQPPASALKKSPSDGGVSSTDDVCELKVLSFANYSRDYRTVSKCQKWKA